MHNVAAVLKNFNFSNITRESDLPWNLDGSLRGRSRRATNWDSLVFKVHTDLQVMEFLGADYLWCAYYIHTHTCNLTHTQRTRELSASLSV
jgi:hypothetical protein